MSTLPLADLSPAHRLFRHHDAIARVYPGRRNTFALESIIPQSRNGDFTDPRL